MNQIYLFVIVFGIVLFKLINSIPSLQIKKIGLVKPHKTDVSEIYKDIYLKPYGCFSSLEEKFFAKQLVENEYDSGTVVKSNNDIKELIQQIIKNGYDIYGYKLLHKYNDNYDKITIIELGILGKLAGYNYISIFKYDETTRGDIYFTYSPPMNRELDVNDPSAKDYLTKSDLPELSLTGKENACGYPCSGTEEFSCGSVGYPTVKTPTRFAVYQIAEQ